jgi:hypothetical protein
MSKLSSAQLAEVEALKALPDDQIDTSDIPPVTDWSQGVRGRFYRPGSGSAASRPIYLDAAVIDFLEARAALKNTSASALANELLRKDVELILAAEG